MKKIWILELKYKTFWKEHGKMTWSRNIGNLIRLIKEGYKVKYCDNENDSVGEWK